jgi:hypothetical protein
MERRFQAKSSELDKRQWGKATDHRKNKRENQSVMTNVIWHYHPSIVCGKTKTWMGATLQSQLRWEKARKEEGLIAITVKSLELSPHNTRATDFISEVVCHPLTREILTWKTDQDANLII